MPDPMLKWFEFEHLPPELSEVCMFYNHLVHKICSKASPSAERTVAMRKLLESRDSAVRAILDSAGYVGGCDVEKAPPG